MSPEQEIERLEREITLLEEMNAVMDQALACQTWEEARVFLRRVIAMAEEDEELK